MQGIHTLICHYQIRQFKHDLVAHILTNLLGFCPRLRLNLRPDLTSDATPGEDRQIDLRGS
jgi:hypothetical protein